MTRPKVREARGEEGAGSVLTIAIVAVVVSVGLLVGGLGVAVIGRAEAQTAADLAVLAAGDTLALELVLGGPARPEGIEEACARAAEVARRNGADLESCHHEGHGVAVVHVVRATPVGDARAAARAGPAGS